MPQDEWTQREVVLLHGGDAPAGLAQSLAGVDLHTATLPNNNAIAPLVLHALHAGDARFLLQWATRPMNELRMNTLCRRDLNPFAASEFIGVNATAQLTDCIANTLTLFDAINAPFTAEQHDMVEAEADLFYDDFVRRVAESRSMTVEEVDALVKVQQQLREQIERLRAQVWEQPFEGIAGIPMPIGSA